MPRLASNDLLVSLPPFQAYAQDVARLGGHAPLTADDDAWLVLAQALARAAALPADARTGFFAATGGALAAIGHALAGNDGAGAEQAALVVCARVQEVVAAQERAGAFRLAFTTLASVQEALGPLVDARTTGLLLAQQGRAARQLGAMETARALYLAAASAGRRGRAADVLARAMMGLGALANMRGNYPEARTAYRRALVYAERAGVVECVRAAHHGLLGAATVAGDADEALTHGYLAFAGTPDDDHDARAEMLVNLAEISRTVDQHRAALGACLTAIELSTNPRLCLPALGSAAMAAATLGERTLLLELIGRAERIIAQSSQPYENAFTLVELAEACETARLDAGATLARRAAEIAEAWTFHEVQMRAERVLHAMASRARSEAGGAATAPTTATPARRWSPPARRALRALETMATTRARSGG